MIQEFVHIKLHYHCRDVNISWLREVHDAYNSSYLLFIWRQEDLLSPVWLIYWVELFGLLWKCNMAMDGMSDKEPQNTPRRELL
jgi:hypothetical protein